MHAEPSLAGRSLTGWMVVLLLLAIPATHSPAAADVEGRSGPPSVAPAVYAARRAALLDSLGEGTAILYSRGDHTDTGYRADGNFWYLTGIDDEGAILLLAPGEEERQVLLLEPRDPEAERWTGARAALTDSLRLTLGFDRIGRTPRLERMIVSHMKHEPVLHLISTLARATQPVPLDLELYEQVTKRVPGAEIRNSSRLLERMRMIKSTAEVESIEQAIRVTHRGLTDLLAAMRPGVSEFQLDGVFEQSLKQQGAQHMAFEPIVGSGEETTILHYERRDQPLARGQLLLLDVGAEWHHYCADVTRTVPVDGTFTPRQAEIYDVVLAALRAAIAAIEPGTTVRQVHEVAKETIRRAGYVDDFIHGTSHHLGLEVHDVADYGLPLAPGMVLTVEPGIYLPDEELGIRLEEDVLVTDEGARVLSNAIPVERGDVEAWVSEARAGR